MRIEKVKYGALAVFALAMGALALEPSSYGDAERERSATLSPPETARETTSAPPTEALPVTRHCKSPAVEGLNATLAGDPLGSALLRAEEHIARLHSARVGQRLRRLRGVSQSLTALRSVLHRKTNTLAGASFDVPVQSRAEAIVEGCPPTALSNEERLARRREYIENHPLLLTGVEGLRLRPDLVHTQEALAAFFAAALITTPAPDRCTFAESSVPYRWDKGSLRQVLKDLQLIPDTLLEQLRTSLQGQGDGEGEGILALLPTATCEKLFQVVCHHLKQARQPQDGEYGLLRARAKSLTEAQGELIALKNRVSNLGCAPLDFGLEDSVAYARSLVAEAQEKFEEDGRDLAIRLESILGRKRASADQNIEEALDLLKVQRLELAALVLGVAGPAISYLNAYNVPLDSQERNWSLAGDELRDVAVGRKPKGPDGSGLSELERFVGLLTMRRAEACELIRSPYAQVLFGQSSGLFFARGRDLVASLRKQCLLNNEG